jgi:hypothetical protein
MYARVDVVTIAGVWHVMEVEVTEPALWLDLAPATTGLLVDAIDARLSARRRAEGPDGDEKPHP